MTATDLRRASPRRRSGSASSGRSTPYSAYRYQHREKYVLESSWGLKQFFIWIHVMLRRILGSVHRITDPDPALFVSGFPDANKVPYILSFFKFFLLLTYWSYCRYIYVSLHRYQVIKKSKKSWNKVFSTFFTVPSCSGAWQPWAFHVS